MICRQNYRPDLSIPLFQELLKREPSADLCETLGEEFWRAGQRRAAINAFQDALRHDPRHRESLFALAGIHTELGNHAQAVRVYLYAASCYPDLAPLRAMLGNAFARQGQFPEAEASYLKALELDPNLRDADLIYYNLARIYARMSEPALSLGALVKAGERSPARAVDAFEDRVFWQVRQMEDFELVVSLGERELFLQLMSLLDKKEGDKLRKRIARAPFVTQLIRSRRRFLPFRMFARKPQGD